MQAITIKQGDTLRFTVSLKDENGEPIILDPDTEIRSQIRTKTGGYIDTFKIVDGGVAGEYEFNTTDTSNYPPVALEFDVETIIGGDVKTGPTAELIVLKDVTKDNG